MTWFPGKPRDSMNARFDVFGGGGSSQGFTQVPANTTTQSTSEPWAQQQPYITQGWQQAQNDILNRPLEFFPGQTYVGPSQYTQQATQGIANRAIQGSPLLQASQQNLQDTLSGQYLQNPAMDQLMSSITRQVKPGVDAEFALSGRGGSPLHTEALARGIADAAAPYAYNDYRQGTEEMQRASALAPSLANQDYYDLSQLAGAGQSQEFYDSQGLGEQLARHEFEQMEPYQRIAAYQGLIGGNYGGTSGGTTTGTQYLPQSPGTSPLLTGLGALGSVASIGSSLFGPFGLFA